VRSATWKCGLLTQRESELSEKQHLLAAIGDGPVLEQTEDDGATESGLLLHVLADAIGQLLVVSI